MIPTLKNYLSGRGKRFALLVIWLALSGAVILTLPGAQATPSVATEKHSDQSVVAGTSHERLETPADEEQAAPSGNSNVPGEGPSAQSSQSANQPANSQKPKPKPAATKITASLKINDVYAGDVTLLSTDNQCDVLTEALDTGIISSLQMKYYEKLKSYGVHVINGIGDPESVEWVYEVEELHGRYLLGCSLTKVVDGDVINWEYVN